MEPEDGQWVLWDNVAGSSSRKSESASRRGCVMTKRQERKHVMSARIRILQMALCTLFAMTGLAEARPDSRSMSCAEIQAAIQSHHALVLTTGPNTYDRYVRQFGNECDWPEVPMSAYIPARDGHCPVYRCDEPVSNFPE
jgi:hypothetical protein